MSSRASESTPVAIALGSNVGDRLAHLDYAVSRLRTFVRDLRVSSWRTTTPVGVSEQPDFLNGVVVGRVRLTPRDLLAALLTIEAERGRERPVPGAPRTLDLDLILYGAHVIDEPGLRVPHPRYRARLFVLEPLAELVPEWVDPETQCTIGALLSDWQDKVS